MSSIKSKLYSVTIIVPVFNEEQFILTTLRELNLFTKNLKSEIIVVNDGSTDSTLKKLQQNSHLYNTLISHKANYGKGKAVRDGISMAKNDYILIQDADLEYSPSDLPRLIGIAFSNAVDLLITTRMNGSELTRVHYFWNRIGNKVITTFFNVLFNTTFTDIFSGYLVVKRDLLDSNMMKSNSWSQQVEILVSIVKRKNHRIFEAPISYRGRTYDEGKKIRAISIFPVLATILFYRIKMIKNAKT